MSQLIFSKRSSWKGSTVNLPSSCYGLIMGGRNMEWSPNIHETLTSAFPVKNFWDCSQKEKIKWPFALEYTWDDSFIGSIFFHTDSENQMAQYRFTPGSFSKVKITEFGLIGQAPPFKTSWNWRGDFTNSCHAAWLLQTKSPRLCSNTTRSLLIPSSPLLPCSTSFIV